MAVERISVSIPEDLKERMDTVTEPVNWSQVAAQAFEVKLAEIAAKKVERTMDDVAQRLRVSKLEGGSKLVKAGREGGRKWAEDKAEWRELEKLNDARDDFERGLKKKGVPYFYKTLDWTTFLGDSASDQADFWNPYGGRAAGGSQLGKHHPHIDFVVGFWIGALEVYDQLKDTL